MSFLTATEIVSGVVSGRLDPVDVIEESLDRVHEREPEINAFREVLAADALQAAADLHGKDVTQLPLAGVPIAIKDSIAVAGHIKRNGSEATGNIPQTRDDIVVKRLKDAGAILFGLTNVPELCVWGTTDDVHGSTRNPWNFAYSAGGSSGGSAAAVASGIVPIAHGTDGMGSVRGPAGACGLFGIKPGSFVIEDTVTEWRGMSESGVLATTVEDAALALSVMADRPEFAHPTFPEMPLRIAISFKPPSMLSRLDPEWVYAIEQMAEKLAAAGHRVEFKEFPYRNNVFALLSRWTVGVYDSTKEVETSKLQRRTKRHANIGRLLLKMGLLKEKQADQQREAAEEFFSEYDVLITPTLNQLPPESALWHKRSWLANFSSNLKYASYPSVWNMIGWPAASIPAGFHRDFDMPLSAQIVAPQGQELLIFQLAKQIEALQPWPLTAI